MLVESVKEGVTINPLAARSVFWELKTAVVDPAFEKEAWISAMLLSHGDCGLTVGDEATVFFALPSTHQVPRNFLPHRYLKMRLFCPRCL